MTWNILSDILIGWNLYLRIQGEKKNSAHGLSENPPECKFSCVVSKFSCLHISTRRTRRKNSGLLTPCEYRQEDRRTLAMIHLHHGVWRRSTNLYDNRECLTTWPVLPMSLVFRQLVSSAVCSCQRLGEHCVVCCHYVNISYCVCGHVIAVCRQTRCQIYWTADSIMARGVSL